MKPPEQNCVLAVDIGTSGIRASVYDSGGAEIPELKAKAATPFAESGTVTPDANELYNCIGDVLDTVAELAAGRGLAPSKAAISCFWHSLVGIDHSGDPTTPVLTWADTSASVQVPELRGLVDEVQVHNRTGCHFHSSFWPAKLLDIRRQQPEVFARTAQWLSFSDLILGRLTGRWSTGISMASATGMFDLRRKAWDTEMIELTGVPAGALPAVMGPGEEFPLLPELRRRWPALAETRWIAPIGDGAANNVGAGAVGEGTASMMIGTSAAMRSVFEGPVPKRIPSGLFCYMLDHRRVCLGGALSDGGSLRRWLSGSLGLDVSEEMLAARLADSGPGGHGLSFLPFVFGERSTGYHDAAEGAVIGLTRGTDDIDLTLAALESIGFRFAEILAKIEEGSPVRRLIASGGSLESSPVWQKIIADILGRDLEIFPEGGVSRRGAALMALAANPSQSEATVIVRHDPAAHKAYLEQLEKHRTFYARMIG